MIRIALFGQPGSGKTTIANLLSETEDYKIIEASTAVIFPILKKEHKNITQENARNIFKKNSPDFVAKTLHALYVDQPKYEKIIFSGLRGIDNARYCRLHNDFVVYLTTPKKELVKRLYQDRNLTTSQALQELKEEQNLYQTTRIEEVADLVIDTSKVSEAQACALILSTVTTLNQMCVTCVNTAKNPAITFDKDGNCNICSAYFKNFDRDHLKNELKFLQSFKNKGTGKYDVLVGLSGGKDSTATLHTIKQMGFQPLAVTLNLGYLPKTTIPRSREMAKLLKTDYELINIQKYIRAIDRQSYRKTATLYEEPFSLETKQKFKQAYRTGRQHYSIKCKHAVSFVRTCQLCRRMVIRAYYGEAIKRGVNVMILGINEWTNLSAAQNTKDYKVSGVRKLQPHKNKPPVYVFHLPFILQRTSQQTKAILNRIGWKPPQGEDFIESNSNSCLFARSTERMAKRLLEFHPDSTRLAREVTVGFITKKQALQALGKIHPYKLTPRQVLKKARII